MAQMSVALETVNHVDPNNKQQVSDLKVIVEDNRRRGFPHAPENREKREISCRKQEITVQC